MNNLSITDLQVIWVVGSVERLATLGVFDSNVPLHISPEAIDTYLLIDEKRHFLFEDDTEVAMIFEVIARSESKEDISKEDMDTMIELVLEYKNNRTQLIKHALEYSHT